MSQKQAQRSARAARPNGPHRPVAALPYPPAGGSGSPRSILAAIVGMFIGGVVVAGGAWAIFTKPWQSAPATNSPAAQAGDTGPCRACDMKPPSRFGEADGDGPP